VENLRFIILNYETKSREEKRNYSIIIVKYCIWFFITLFLGNKKTIIYKRKERYRNRNKEIFSSFFENIKKRVIYSIKKVGKRADLCPTSTSTLKEEEVK